MKYQVRVYDEKRDGSELIVVKEFENIAEADEYGCQMTASQMFDWAELYDINSKQVLYDYISGKCVA